MASKTVLRWGLLAFVLASLGYAAFREARPAPPSESAVAVQGESAVHSDEAAAVAAEQPKTEAQPKVVVYYFHGMARCTTCTTMEAYAHEALDANFADELASGDLAWRVVNVEEPDNEHFVNDYNLYTKSLVLAKFEDGTETEWTNLDKIWDLVGDEDAYKTYVRENVASLLGTPQ